MKLLREDAGHMAQALALGRRGLGQGIAPSPAVGCILVRDGRIVGRGWTQPGGRPHGEAMALAQAGGRARGATAYVTLEPCAHESKRGPCCTDSLIAAGVRRVVSALEDPDPRTAGQGHARLRAAGIDVVTGLLADEARRDHAGFLLRQAEGRPFVTLKLAASLDGRIATATGESKWITGPQARAMVHAMRASHDAVMVGGGTARADDPQLNVRGMGTVVQPVRVIWSAHLDLPQDGFLARTAGEIPLWLVHDAATRADRGAWEALGARLIPVRAEGRSLDPLAALQALGAAGLTRVFCEGGGALAATLLAAGLVDELVMFSAGLSIGAEGRPMIGALGLDRLAAAERLELVESRPIGGDLLHRWRRI